MMRLSTLHSGTRTLGHLVIVYCLITSASAIADEADTPSGTTTPTAQSTGSEGLQEITVTARRREENLQVVPVAVTAYDQAALEALQIRKLDDLSTVVPNLNIFQTQGSQNGASVSIRGIGNDASTIEDEPSVGLYVNGVYIGQNIGSLMNMIDISHVEVLRGPQGTLYGRNTMGGAIKVETARPSTDDTSVSTEIAVGSYNRVDAKAFANVPITDNIAANVSVASLNNSGWYKDAITNDTLNRRETATVRGALLVRFSDSLDLFFTSDFTRDRSGLFVGTPMTTLDPATTVPIYGLYKAAPSLPDHNRFSGWGTSAELDWNTGIGQFVSISAFREQSYVQSYDLSDTPTGLKLTRPGYNQHQVSQEFQYNSSWSGPLSLTAGLYYFRENAYEELDFIVPLVPPLVLPYISTQTSHSAAVYGELNWAITHALKLTVGARETWDKKSIERGGIFEGVSASQPYSDFTPRGLVSYQLTNDFMLYATASKGYSAGRYQGFPSSAAAAAVSTPPEKVTAYEVGAKTEWFDRRLTANLSMFYNKYTDLGVTVGTGTNQLIEVLSADSVAQGAELEISARPIPQLTLNGQVSRLNTEYTNVPDVPGAPILGQPLRYSPPWSAGGNAEYRLPVTAAKNLVLGAGFVWSDTNITTGVPFQPFFVQTPYWLFNARIMVEDTSKHWQLELSGQNLSSTAWFDTASVLSGGLRYYNPPATWAVTFRINL